MSQVIYFPFFQPKSVQMKESQVIAPDLSILSQAQTICTFILTCPVSCHLLSSQYERVEELGWESACMSSNPCNKSPLCLGEN